jgi:hypothetical protein
MMKIAFLAFLGALLCGSGGCRRRASGSVDHRLITARRRTTTYA